MTDTLSFLDRIKAAMETYDYDSQGNSHGFTDTKTPGRASHHKEVGE